MNVSVFKMVETNTILEKNIALEKWSTLTLCKFLFQLLCVDQSKMGQVTTAYLRVRVAFSVRD